MDEVNENYVRVDFNDIFWHINVEDTGEKNGKEPIIKLSWGWNANEDRELTKEGWHGMSVRILLSQAITLRDNLDSMISRHNESSETYK